MYIIALSTLYIFDLPSNGEPDALIFLETEYHPKHHPMYGLSYRKLNTNVWTAEFW